jgi:murein DD-endopeptidase MepM/ murein hydrolase activator NlpD
MTIRPRSQNSIRVGPSKSRPTGLYFVLVVSLLANVYFVIEWRPPAASVASAAGEGSLTETTVAAARAAAEAGEQEPPGSAAARDAAQASPASADAPSADPSAGGSADAAGEAGKAVPVADAAAAARVIPGAAAPGPAALPPGSRYARVLVKGAISHGFEKAVGAEGVRLAMVASRLLIWNLNLNRDPRKGDTIDLIYQAGDGSDGITIFAIRYHSQKFSRTFDAYRFQPASRGFSSYFDSEGREVPARLRDGPIEKYQEITSLIGDGRGHHGMDFKAPVGSAVVAPWDGHVLRTNWNWKYNGNSVELRSLDGRRTARFLHLDKLSAGIEAKVRVKAGQQLAVSGNTGRSFAPHLHYELSDGSGRILDPLDVHDTYHPRLSGDELRSFKEAMGTLAAGLSGDRGTAPAG